jgi:ABC-2 type transport system ATP-binding protein
MVVLEHLSKTFGSRLALNDLSLEITKGEIFGLLGHNGAGKSTTFGILLGQVHPDIGEARINGHSVQKDRAQALRRVGAIFETPAFYDYMSGWDNLSYFVSLTEPVPASRLKEIVEMVGLTDRIRDKVRAYSHGMRQRLALAQALLPDPEFIVLDEPTEGLDPEGIREMREMIRRLRAEHGLTVLLSSHLLSEVEQLCDRVAILHKGNLVFTGTWQEEGLRWKFDIDDWAKAAPVFAKFGGTIEADHIVRFETDRVAEVVAELVSSGIRVSEVARHRLTLEDFYLNRIGL